MSELLSRAMLWKEEQDLIFYQTLPLTYYKMLKRLPLQDDKLGTKPVGKVAVVFVPTSGSEEEPAAAAEEEPDSDDFDPLPPLPHERRPSITGKVHPDSLMVYSRNAGTIPGAQGPIEDPYHVHVYSAAAGTCLKFLETASCRPKWSSFKLGLSPSHHFGKAKVYEEAEEKTTHNKCGCEAQVHVLQLAFHIMEPHTIKWGFLPNIPGPLPGFDFIIEHHNESPFVLAVNKALTWRRLEGHSGGSHLQNDLVDLTAAAMRAQQLRLFCLARSSTSSNAQNSMHEEDRGTSSSIVPEEHSRCLLIQEASPREASNKCLALLPDKSRLLPQTN